MKTAKQLYEERYTNGDHKCPQCGKTNLIPSESFVFLYRLKQDNITPNGPDAALFSLRCSDCSYVLLFSARQSGIL